MTNNKKNIYIVVFEGQKVRFFSKKLKLFSIKLNSLGKVA